MINAQTNLHFSKSRGLLFLEYVLFAICLGVIALRATYTESPVVQTTGQGINLTAGIYGLLISTFLLMSLVCYLLWGICSRSFCYRFTGIEIGLGLFVLSAIIAGWDAADKRAAITSFILFISPVLAAVLLTQILDCPSKIKLLLVSIAALGAVNTWQCGEQLFISNQVTIEQYEQAPQNFLEPLDIEPGSLAHWLFEHRLYSRGIRGFFTTGNSAGSFFLLAIFSAAVLFLDRLKNRKSGESTSLSLLAAGFIVVVNVFGLIITRSKGAIAAFIIAAAMFTSYLLFGNWLKTRRKAVLAICLSVLIISGCLVVLYGLRHGRLPGGNSMLVRWQYWTAAAKMYADNPITGIGPGNFTHIYTHYKPPSALEAVADPHNFILSIITQYGPLGLVGFLAMVFVPLLRITFPAANSSSPKYNQPPKPFNMIAFAFLAVVSIVMLCVRPVLLPMPTTDLLAVKIYVIFILYLVPVIILIAAFLLLTLGAAKTADIKPGPHKILRSTQYEICNTNTIAALFCACLGVLFHNLLDFAIFEPAVLTSFWAVLACIIALDWARKPARYGPLKSVRLKAVLVILVLAAVGGYFYYCLIPPVESAVNINKAHYARLQGNFERARELLDESARDDLLSPAALSLNGRFQLQRFYESAAGEINLLLDSEKYLLEAIERNKADYKNYERLTEIYILLAESCPEPERTQWLQRAFDAASAAVRCYPGCGRLHFSLAEVAEQLQKKEVALEGFEKALEIEDAFRGQFRVMYPQREVFSRLGEGKYQAAKQKIKQLSPENTQ